MKRGPTVHRKEISDAAFRRAKEAFNASLPGTSPKEHPWQIENRCNLSEQQLANACLLLDRAHYQKNFASSPLLSGFRVGSSAWCRNGLISLGANYEYGAGVNRAYDQSVHSEEAAVADALIRFGRETRLELLAIATDADSPSGPCGRCRSELETYGCSDLTHISVGNNVSATMWTISELLPNTFRAITPCELSHDQSELLHKTREAIEHSRATSFAHFSEKTLGKEGAAIVTDGEIFSLPRVDSLAFYGTTALRGTIAAALRKQPRRLDSVVFVSRTGIPVGEDRQLLYEFASFFDQADTVPVYLLGEATGTIQVATPSTLLPYAFGPRDLGINLTRP